VIEWQTLLGDHPVTRPLREGRVSSPALRLDVADAAPAHPAFRRVVRDLEFDVAELPLMTFLMARSRGIPLRLLPVALFSRNPLRHLVCRATFPFEPAELAGRRIGTRAYTTTLAIWMRALLTEHFRANLDAIEWLTYQESAVPGIPDPESVHRDAAHADLLSLLFDGAIDAAILDPVPLDPRLDQVVLDADAEWNAWKNRTGADTIEHVVVVRESLAGDSRRMSELFRLFRDSGDLAEAEGAARPLIGLAPMRPSLEAAIAATRAQGLLATPLTMDEVVTPEIASVCRRPG